MTPILLALLLVAAAAGPAAAQTTSLEAVSQARLVIQGTPASGSIGRSIASIPNLTGDHRPALAIASPYESLPGRTRAGVVYVVFDTPRAGTVALGDPTLHGFRIIGGPYYDAGLAVTSAGDVNGDGRGDILLSAPRHGITCRTPMSGPCGYRAPAVAFVIYGKADEGTVDLAHLKPSQGFEIKGIPGGAGTGAGVLAGLGNFAGDGLSAIAVSGVQYTASGLNYREGVYVIYGSRHPSDVDLQNLGTRGFRIDTQSGGSVVAAVGDVNGDGRTDLMLNAGDPSHYEDFVLFGRRYQGTISPGRAGASGFAITGLNGYGFSFGGVGDVNGDHRADVLAVRNLLGSTGGAEVDVVYGAPSSATVNLTHLGARGARILTGPAPAGSDVQLWGFTGLGDLNGDGRADFAIASETWPTSSGGGFLQGTVSVIYGAPFASPLSLANLGSAGYQLTGPSPSAVGPTGDELGFGVAALNGFAEEGRPLFAVGAPGLGLPGMQPGVGAFGEVLLEP
ncbi:MAG TPA: hypothetical protein VK272_07615 [Solirubrobacteraceae bacterium]|nr:hypothetical protein [Solirubrobacteraceae bacterium]